MKTRRLLFAAAALAATTITAQASATVKVKLWDMGDKLDLSQPLKLGFPAAGGMKGAMTGVKADKSAVPAGPVTFVVTNSSKETVHEMLISPVADDKKGLPFVDKENRVDEEAAGHLGEVSELDPGKSGKLTIDLKPGKYILFCNVPAHFMSGMWTTITVR